MELDDNEIWEIYILLNKVEKAFRALKTDLRPIYHQTLKRTETHTFLTILAYHLLNCIEKSFEQKDKKNMSWNKIIMLLNTHQTVSIHFTDEKEELNIIRKTTKLEAHHIEIYKRPGVDISKPNINNRRKICKV